MGSSPCCRREAADGARHRIWRSAGLLALQRAATARDPVQRVGALWEAIEFYVGKRNPRRRFTRNGFRDCRPRNRRARGTKQLGSKRP
jgi:hypothetical protein